ncbi:MAG: SDR family oxidoreductase [Candidatus Kapaibacterium sp.]
MKLELKGRNALVCGASEGIGAAIARQLAKIGANVTILSRNKDKIDKQLANLDTSQGNTHDWVVADLSDPDVAASEVRRRIDDGRNYHVLVNNSGGPPPGAITDAKISDFQSAIRAHLFASQLLTRELVPGMKSDGWGRIINIISVGARRPIDNLGVSNTVRGAMMSWSKTLATELAPYGITVNNILPGHTDTSRLRSLMEKKSKKSSKSIQEIEAEMQALNPMGRFGKPEELGYLGAFLASDYASYITGVSIPVDGGFLKCL